MKRNFNIPFLAFLAWMAALMCITILSSCSTTGARYGAAYDDMSPRKCGKTSQTYRHW
jgi:hypothetical protein